MKVLLGSIWASLAVLVTYLALGGATYQPSEVADPCDPRPIEAPVGLDATLQQIALSAMDGAACELRVTREDLLAALADPESRAAFLDESQTSDAELEAALRAGLDRAYEDAVRTGSLDGFEALVVGQAIEIVPIDLVVDLAQTDSAQEAAEQLFELGEGGTDPLDVLGGLLD